MNNPDFEDEMEKRGFPRKSVSKNFSDEKLKHEEKEKDKNLNEGTET